MQVDNPDAWVALSKAVNAPDALLHSHRVPRHVVVDQGAAELEVQAFGGGIRAQQNVSLAVTKAPFGVIAADLTPTAVGRRNFPSAAREAHEFQIGVLSELAAKKVHGVGVLGKDHGLLIAVSLEIGKGAFQAGQFAVRRQLGDTGQKVFNVGLFFSGEGLALQASNLFRIQHLVAAGVIVRRVIVQAHQ